MYILFIKRNVTPFVCNVKKIILPIYHFFFFFYVNTQKSRDFLLRQIETNVSKTASCKNTSTTRDKIHCIEEF